MQVTYDNIIFSLQRAGGISALWYELLRRALADREMEVTCMEDPGSTNIFRKRLSIPPDRLFPGTHGWLPLRARRYLRASPVPSEGVFHSSYYRTARGRRLRNVTTLHDFTYEYYRSGPAKWVHHWQKSAALRHSDAIICVSENTKADLLKFCPDLKGRSIQVVHNGVDDAYRPLPERNDAILRPLIPFSTNEYVLYVGERKSAYKNFRLSVQACARVKRPLVFVGGGAVTMEERAFLDAQLGPNRHTHLLGLDNQTLNILYNHAFCFLYPSLYEGFGIPILEAQRAGCPVVSTNRSSIPEVAGEGAFLVDDVSVAGVSGMLEHIAGADTETRRKVQMGAANAHRFSWDKCYLETKHVYEQLLRS